MNSYPQQSFSPDDENRGSIVDTLGKIALGAGTLAAGVAGYRRLKGLDTKTGRRVNTISEEDLRKPATTKTSPGDPRYDNVRRAAQGVPNITTGAVDPAPAPLSSLERYRNLEKLTRTARDERMPGTLADLSKIAQTSASAAAGLSAVPQVAKPARQTPKVSSGPEQIVPQGEFNTIEIPDQVDRVIESLGQELELNRQQRIVRGIEGREIGLGKNILAGFRREAREEAEAAKNTPAKTFLASKLASEGYIDTAVTRQQANAPQVSLQSAEAVDTGIDQAVQRNKVAAQRDHDRDLSQLEVLEDIAEQNEQLMRREATPDQMIGYEPDAAVKSAIAQQPGGALRDQTDTSLGQSAAARFLANERDEIASQLGEQGLAITPGRVDRELANRLGRDSYLYGPEYTQMKQTMQLGATYDPNLLKNPDASEVRIQDQEFPISFFKEETIMPATVERQKQRIQDQKDFSQGVREAEAFKAGKISGEIDSITQQISDYQQLQSKVSALPKAFKTKEERDAALLLKRDLDAASVAQDQLQDRLENLQYKLYQGEKRVAGAERSSQERIQEIKDQGLPLKLKDPTGAGMEIGPKDTSIVTDLKYEGGGEKPGVRIGPDSGIEYEVRFTGPPKTQESEKTRGSSMQYDQGDQAVQSVYGEQLGGFGQGVSSQQAAAQPSLVEPEAQKYRGGFLTNPLQVESPSAQLEARKEPAGESFYITSRQPAISTAVRDSEIMRRARIEGRNPQSFLRKYTN